MMFRSRILTGLSLALGGALFVASCSESPVRTGPSPITAGGSTNIVNRVAEGNEFELCKDFAVTPPAGTTVTFTVRVNQDNTGFVSKPSVTLSPGQCQVIWTDVGIGRDIVEVTEQVPAGYQTPTWVRTIIGIDSPPVTDSGTGATVSGPVAHADVGTLVVFTNRAVPPPPPGDEGCTPGYWKNHPESWQGFSTSQSFDAVFGLGSPGLFSPDITLLQALQLGGGGFNKLARTAVAALLNAAHSGIDYPLTTAQVISRVQSSFASGNPEPNATNFDTMNNLGCSIDD